MTFWLDKYFLSIWFAQKVVFFFFSDFTEKSPFCFFVFIRKTKTMEMAFSVENLFLGF